MSANKQLDELLISATESDNADILSQIITILSKSEKPLANNIKDGLLMIVESWQLEPFTSPNKANFLIEITQFFDDKFQELRAVLPSVMKKTLPAGVNKTTAIKALKIRNEDTTLSKFYLRYKNLIELKAERFFYNTSSSIWGIIGKTDWITGSLTLLKLNGTILREVELPLILDQIYIFDSKLKLDTALKAKKLISSDELRKKLNDTSYTTADKNAEKKALFSLFVPEKMAPAAFNKWWNASTNAAGSSSTKKIASLESCRSTNELSIFIKENPSFSVTDDCIPKLSKLFNNIKPTSLPKDYIQWAETISLISKTLSSEQIMTILPQDSRVKEIIWPDLDNLDNNIIWMNIWCQIRVGFLPVWAKITELAKEPSYLTELALELPWRCWRSIAAQVKTEDLERRISAMTRLSNPESLLWVWRNKEKLSDALTKRLNHTNYFFALGREADIAIWEESKKELKKLIEENAEFQNHILKANNESTIMDFLEKLNHSTCFKTSEKQSLIVRLSRKYPIFKKIFESGKAKKILQPSSKDKKKQKKDERYITSEKSFNEKINELKDLINVQIPENTEAIATARAHGDLRENAEYAAAKERQKYLNGHRLLLEVRIAKTEPTDFSDITVTDKIIVGSTVCLKYDDNNTDIYHILGAWDSVPEKHLVSYETQLGKALIGKKIGETVKLPGDVKCTIKKITPLSEEIRKNLI